MEERIQNLTIIYGRFSPPWITLFFEYWLYKDKFCSSVSVWHLSIRPYYARENIL